MKERIYQAAIYLRMSKEDGDIVDSTGKTGSDSINNQRNLINEFLKTQKNIEVVSERVDDGYSGTNFDRPAFISMMEDIKAGVVDCVICKDLSRFGREYIGTGKYIERIFPSMGVRFIAVTDNIDSINKSSQADEIIVPFKNLINDAYARDISMKVRSHLEIKRKNGEFIGAFCPYGYKKSENNKNALEIDILAANVVKEIFKLKLNGMSQDAIANHLNDEQVPSPLEYKLQNGDNYNTSFKTNEKALWSSKTIKRILENRYYIGEMVQGKVTTANHKVKKRIEKPEEDWVVVPNSHEPIVNERDFEIVQRLLAFDTRISPLQKTVFPLSGIAVCAECGASMRVVSTTNNGKRYEYYHCSSNLDFKSCASHRISRKALEKTVLVLLQNHIASILDLEGMFKFIDTVPFQELDLKVLDDKLQAKEQELVKYKGLRDSLYEDMKLGIVTKEDYVELREAYSIRCKSIEQAIFNYKQEIKSVLEMKSDKYEWIEYFKEYKNIDTLTRNVVVKLIKQVKVTDKKNIEVVFDFDDSYQRLLQLIDRQKNE